MIHELAKLEIADYGQAPELRSQNIYNLFLLLRAYPSYGRDVQSEIGQLDKGRSIREALKLWFVLVMLLGGGGAVLSLIASWQLTVLLCASSAALSWLLFLRFFRDFTPRYVESEDAIVSPAHGVVDAVEFRHEAGWLKQKCWRVSIYLTLRDVHVQNAPISGTLQHLEFSPGARRRAIHADAGQKNEALILHFQDTCDPARQVLLRLIAGVFVRRIVPWIAAGAVVQRGQRISLIRFGSRVDVYIPSTANITVRCGERVIGSETVLAIWPRR